VRVRSGSRWIRPVTRRRCSGGPPGRAGRARRTHLPLRPMRRGHRPGCERGDQPRPLARPAALVTAERGGSLTSTTGLHPQAAGTSRPPPIPPPRWDPGFGSEPAPPAHPCAGLDGEREHHPTIGVVSRGTGVTKKWDTRCQVPGGDDRARADGTRAAPRSKLGGGTESRGPDRPRGGWRHGQRRDEH
jgi:hypothetical protein